MIELGHHIVLAKQYVGSISGLYIDQSARFAAADNDVYHSPQAAVAIALPRILNEFYSYNLLGQEGCHFGGGSHNTVDTCLYTTAIGFQAFAKSIHLQVRNGKVQHQVVGIVGILHGSGGRYYNHAVYFLRDIAARYHHLVQRYLLFFQDDIPHLYSALGVLDDNLLVDITDVGEFQQEI